MTIPNRFLLAVEVLSKTSQVLLAEAAALALILHHRSGELGVL